MEKVVVQINATCGVGSTGKICVDISKLLAESHIENYILYGSKSNGYELGISCASKSYTKLQSLKSRILGNYGFNSQLETKRIIKYLETIKPDIIHLHNIHGHDCNLEMLFNYFKRKKIKIIWTFHDCWAFTGYCTHFIMSQCQKWKTGCYNCVQRHNYSFLFDKSKENYFRKKELFSGLNMVIVTPSRWMSDLIKQSFLKSYQVIIINNGIDLTIFRPLSSNIKDKYHIPMHKKVILGVAFDWGISKGLDIFIDLAKKIDNSLYQIVLVGTNDDIDRQIPSNIISIHRTQNQQELVELYSCADVFINPTREDTYPTVNMESIACGTPVITFETGGSPEIVSELSGLVIKELNATSMLNGIEILFKNDKINSQTCVNEAKQFDKDYKFQEYIKLYNSILE